MQSILRGTCLPVVSLRYFTAYEPRRRPDTAISKWTRSMFENKPIPIYGTGEQTRDITFVDDTINGTISSAETDGVESETFNIGSGSRVSVNEVVEMLIGLTQSRKTRITNEAEKSGGVQDTHADITEVKQVLQLQLDYGHSD